MTLESVEVLDPTISPRKENTLLADRPETLDGSIVGLLANGKRNSEELLKYVYVASKMPFPFQSTEYLLCDGLGRSPKG